MANRWVHGVPGGPWGALRGLLIAVLLVAHCSRAIPFPKGPDEEDLADGEWREDDLNLWYEWTTLLVPVDIHKPTFDDLVISGFSTLYEVGQVVRAPTKPFFTWLKINQQWGLFAVVTHSPDALVIEARTDGEWRLLEKRLHPTADWHDEQFKYRRLRGIWDIRKKPAGHYKNFTRWVAEMAFAEFPEVDRVKIYLERREVPPPWLPEAPIEDREVLYLRSHKRKRAEDREEPP